MQYKKQRNNSVFFWFAEWSWYNSSISGSLNLCFAKRRLFLPPFPCSATVWILTTLSDESQRMGPDSASIFCSLFSPSFNFFLFKKKICIKNVTNLFIYFSLLLFYTFLLWNLIPFFSWNPTFFLIILYFPLWFIFFLSRAQTHKKTWDIKKFTVI